MSKIFTFPNRPLDWAASPHDFTGDNNLGIYTTETTQRYVYGTRYITWDGRVYKYMGVTTQGCNSNRGAYNNSAAALEWTANAVTKSAGERVVSITQTTAGEDDYVGAQIRIYMATMANSTSHMVVGNDAAGSTYTDLYIEFPLPAALTTSDTFEVFNNPYKAVQVTGAAQAHAGWMGIPCVTATTGYNIWVQTWGPAVVGTGNTTIDDRADHENVAHWSYNGTIREIDDAESNTVAGKAQVAGYILNQGNNIAGPQIYLMCST